MKDYPQNSMANENSILKDISIVGQEALSSLLLEGAFYFCREFCNVFIFTSALIFFSKSTLRVYDSILEISETKTTAKRENMR